MLNGQVSCLMVSNLPVFFCKYSNFGIKKNEIFGPRLIFFSRS